MAATLSNFFPPFQSNKLIPNSTPLPLFHFQHRFLCYYSHPNLPRISDSLIKKSRGSRKVKSEEELRNDIKEFLSTVGLPQDHVPSINELSHHGRQDLANIVRRRGYKFIRQILAVQLQKESDLVEDVLVSGEAATGESGFADDVSLSNNATELEWQTEDSVEGVSLYHEATTSEENMNGFSDDISLSSEVERRTEDLVEGVSLSRENTKGEENVNDFAARQTEDLDENVSSSSEVTKDEENMDFVTDYNSLSSEATEVEGRTKDLAEDLSVPDIATEDEENVINLAENVSLCEDTISKVNITNAETSRELKPDAQSHKGQHSSSNLSFEEKVAKFVQDGELDDVEDAVKLNSDSVHGTHEDLAFSGADGSDLSNGHVTLLHQPVLSNEKVKVGNHNEDPDVEAQNTENQAELNRLKHILHQKELELTKLKEQIEQEKHALYLLQSKAEKEISKAHKLISEKDAELHAAEESLSGLKEVEIRYWGEGEMVEVAGSFNGWHQNIKMEPLLSSSAIDLTGLLKSCFWGTVMWLYPGVYEIKFIVDGNWTLDPQMETVSKHGIHNNVLRVD